MKALLAALWLAFAAGDASFPTPTVLSAKTRPYHPQLRIAEIPDIQNYVTTIDAGDDTVREKLLELITSDVIAWHPDLVIQVGDLTDSTGGQDQSTDMMPFDDPNDQGLLSAFIPFVGTPNDREWERGRKKFYDPILAAGIPVFLVLGNHDSGVDLERWYPKTEWLSYSYGRKVFARSWVINGLAGPPWRDNRSPGGSRQSVDDTELREGLFQTPIGPICVIGMPVVSFTGQSLVAGTDPPLIGVTGLNNGDTVLAPNDWGSWLVPEIGCGGGYPTIVVMHGQENSFSDLQGYYATAVFDCTKIVAFMHGHVVNTPGALNPVQLPEQFPLAANTEFNRANGSPFVANQRPSCKGGVGGYVDFFSDFQELDPGAPGGTNHTGVSWWTKVTIDPAANTFETKASNPLRRTEDERADEVNTFQIYNWTRQLPFNWCTTFVGTPGC